MPQNCSSGGADQPVMASARPMGGPYSPDQGSTGPSPGPLGSSSRRKAPVGHWPRGAQRPPRPAPRGH